MNLIALFKSKNIAEIIQVVSLLTLSVYLVLPYAAVSITLAVFVISSLFLKRNIDIPPKVIFFQLAFYLLLIFTLLYSDNIASGVGELKGNISLIILPFFILFFHNPLLEKSYKYLFLLYVLANLAMVFLLFHFFSNGIITDRFPNLIEEGILAQLKYLWSYPFEFVLAKSLKGTSSWFMNHKTILALNFFLACLFALKLFFIDFKASILKYFLLIPIAILVPAIVYTQALVSIALLPLLLLYTLIYLNGNVSRAVFVLLVSSLVIVSFFKFDLKETFNNGNTDSVVNLFQGLQSGEINEDADPRLFIYYCDKELIQDHFVFGYGVGDVQDQLNNCYGEHGFKPKVKEERIFNSHNFYAHLLLVGGIFALLAFFAMYFYNAKVAFSQKDYAFLFFLFIFSVNLFFDNIILRFQGALCFAFFNALFLMNNLNSNRWEK